MNIIEAIRIWSDHLSNYVGGRGEFWEAQEHISSLVDAYDALEPDWTQAPDWAQWCAINANGLRYWFDVEPLAMHGATGWVNRGNDKQSFDKEVRLPLGIAWTICIWQRPEAQP